VDVAQPQVIQEEPEQPNPEPELLPVTKVDKVIAEETQSPKRQKTSPAKAKVIKKKSQESLTQKASSETAEVASKMEEEKPVAPKKFK
jgi:hypothetical protein